MRSFSFRLERLLAWRSAQASAELLKMQPLVAEMQGLVRRAAELQAARALAASELRSRASFDGWDLAALDAHRARLERQGQALAGEQADTQRRLAAQRVRWFEARRRLELLQTLRTRRFAQWTQGWNRELEGFAAESYLARWNRADWG